MNGNAGVADKEISPNNQAKTPKSGEGEESPHRSPFDEEAIGLNDFFASKTNGHHEPDMGACNAGNAKTPVRSAFDGHVVHG
jgi:hypothetical protein